MITDRDSETRCAQRNPAHVVPLPIALYESNGLLFELYDGGQPYRAFIIRWERLKPIVKPAKTPQIPDLRRGTPLTSISQLGCSLPYAPPPVLRARAPTNSLWFVTDCLLIPPR